MNRWQLRGRARRTLRQLRLRPPLDVDLLVERLGRRLGKPIELHAEDLIGRNTFGFLWNDPAAEMMLLVYEAKTSRAHQIMIILHELSHLILGHPGQAVDQSSRAPGKQQARRPGLFGAGRRGPTTRTLYDDRCEWEAETMATIMASWVTETGGYVAPEPTSRLDAILGDPTAW